MTYTYYFTFFVQSGQKDPFEDLDWENSNCFIETSIESNSPEITKSLIEEAKRNIREKVGNHTFNLAIVTVVRTLNNDVEE